MIPFTVPCGTCGGTGMLEDSCPTPDGPCGYRVRCPDCVDGQWPDDATVEARALELAMELGHTLASVNPPKPGPNTLRMARADLVAAARHQEGNR